MAKDKLRLFFNIVGSYSQIFVSAAVNLSYVPIAIGYMGVDSYGIWIILITMIGYFSIANFGIPTAVTNLMCMAQTCDNKKEIFLKGTLILFTISALIIVLLIALYFLNVPLISVASTSKLPALCLILLFLCGLPFQVSSSVFISEHKIYLSKAYEILVTISTLAALLIVKYSGLDMLFLALFTGGLGLLIRLSSFLHAFLIIKGNNFSNNRIRFSEIYRPGLALFGSSIGSLIIWNTDNLIVAKMLGLADVTVYSTAFRLFTLAFSSFAIMHAISVPYYGKAFASKNFKELRKYFLLCLSIIPFGASLVWIIGWIFANEILGIWLGSYSLYANRTLYFILGAYGFAFSFVGVMFNILSSLNIVRSLFYISIGEAVVNLISSLILTSKYGIVGPAMGTLIASVCVPLLFLPRAIKGGILAKLEFSANRMIATMVGICIIMGGLYYFQADQNLGLISKCFVLLLSSIAFAACTILPYLKVYKQEIGLAFLSKPSRQ